MDSSYAHQALAVHQEVSLSASDLLAAVGTAGLPAYAGRLGRLATLKRTRTRRRRAACILSRVPSVSRKRR